MAQNIIMDLANIKQSSATELPETFETFVSDSPNSNHETSDENNNNGSLSSKSGFSTSPAKYNCFIILDMDAEDILQNMNNELFQQCFHFDKMMVRCLLIELHQRTYYHPLEDVNRGLSFDMSVLVTLSYLVNGNMDMLALLRPLTHCPAYILRKAVQKMCFIIVHFLTPIYVTFPSSQEEQQVNKEAFLRQFGIPGAVGVLDYYHVKLEHVPEYEMHMYINHQCRRPSLAVQLICDQNYRFLDVNSRFSGSTHNIYIWRRSHINGILLNSQKINPKTWLIGTADRGYHLSSCLINPYRNATDMLQESVNVALKEVQNVALKSFALLKARFRCLNTALPFNHKNATNVITACVTLHNYLLAKKWAIEGNLEYYVPKKKNLPNARYEDEFSPEGLANREFIKDFMYDHSMQVLYKMRKQSNINFMCDIDHN